MSEQRAKENFDSFLVDLAKYKKQYEDGIISKSEIMGCLHGLGVDIGTIWWLICGTVPNDSKLIWAYIKALEHMERHEAEANLLHAQHTNPGLMQLLLIGLRSITIMLVRGSNPDTTIAEYKAIQKSASMLPKIIATIWKMMA